MCVFWVGWEQWNNSYAYYRAWLAVQGQGVSNFKKGEWPVVLMLLQNVGQVPAFAVSHRVNSGIVPYPLPSEARLHATGPLVNDGNIFPRAAANITVRSHLQPEDFDKIVTGVWQFAVWGKVRYQNGLDHAIHTTPYCFVVIRDSIFQPFSGRSQIWGEDCSNRVSTEGDQP